MTGIVAVAVVLATGLLSARVVANASRPRKTARISIACEVVPHGQNKQV